MTSQTPRIAVLIPAYNTEKVIGHTLDSLKANKEPHDIIIIDDGSTTPLEGCVPPQNNLEIVRVPENSGVTKALNLGLTMILEQDYEYLARIDADDVASPDRLAMQRKFLDEHPEVGFVGSWGHFVSEEGKTVFHLHPPEDHDFIVKKLYYNNCFLHPSLMIRTSLLHSLGGYNEAYPSAEDYDILRRLSIHSKGANLPDYLINYMVSPTGISLSKRREQLFSRLKIQWSYRNWCSIHFYLGIAKTLCLGVMPYKTITAIKKMRKEYQKR